jgi:hypothetical protein
VVLRLSAGVDRLDRMSPDQSIHRCLSELDRDESTVRSISQLHSNPLKDRSPDTSVVLYTLLVQLCYIGEERPSR